MAKSDSTRTVDSLTRVEGGFVRFRVVFTAGLPVLPLEIAVLAAANEALEQIWDSKVTESNHLFGVHTED